MNHIIKEKYGKLTISDRISEKRAIFQCECGSFNEYAIKSVIEGRITSCRCNRTASFIGMKYNHLTVMEISGPDFVNCQCDCGNNKRCRIENLLNGNPKSCGCKRISSYIGKVFGKLFIKTPSTKGKAICECDCGNETDVYIQNVVRGLTTSCGCTWYPVPPQEGDVLICSTCGVEKKVCIDNFRLHQGNYMRKCKDCVKEYMKPYLQKYGPIWREIPENHERLLSNRRQRRKEKENSSSVVREAVSRMVWRTMSDLNLTKDSKSVWKDILPYSPQELWNHLEKQFEPWMNKNNHGTYRRADWDDNDSSTWKWQLDHLIPHSCFKYTSMEEEFKKCWALSNLRPLSAKQNLLDGNRR